MMKTFAEQCEIYKKQQTVSGKATQTALEKMCRKMSEITRHDLSAGTLTPLINERTGKITGFI